MAVTTGEFRDSDAGVVDLLRGDVPLGIGDLAGQLGVTATAVRQRLERLMKAGLVERRAVAKPRGRPAHVYSLTASGRRLGGDNFRDLAMVLWRELRSVADESVRRGLVARVANGLAAAYRDRITGATSAERLAGVAALLADRDIACTVGGDALPVLTTHACPYPDLAEQDRAVCSAERLMIQELVGVAVHLSECRLDGGSCCRFTAAEAARDSLPGVETTPVASSNADRFHPHQVVTESLS